MTHIHCCIDLSAIIRRDQDLLGLLRHCVEHVRNLDDNWIVAGAVIMQAKGMDAWPLCSHFDKMGHCLGHHVDGNHTDPALR